MRPHGSGYGFRHGGHGPRILDVLRSMPRRLKIGLLMAALFVALMAVALVVLIVVMLVNLAASGMVPVYLEGALDFARRNLQPLLELGKSLQSLAGK